MIFHVTAAADWCAAEATREYRLLVRPTIRVGTVAFVMASVLVIASSPGGAVAQGKLVAIGEFALHSLQTC